MRLATARPVTGGGCIFGQSRQALRRVRCFWTAAMDGGMRLTSPHVIPSAAKNPARCYLGGAISIACFRGGRGFTPRQRRRHNAVGAFPPPTPKNVRPEIGKEKGGAAWAPP